MRTELKNAFNLNKIYFKINELVRPLGALHLGQDLVSLPGPPNQISVHAWQPARGVLWGTRLHIQHENVSSIDSKYEKLNFWQKASFLYFSICLSFLILPSLNSPKVSSLWVPTSDLLLFGNGELVTFSPKDFRRLSRLYSFTANTFLDPTFQKFDPEFQGIKSTLLFLKKSYTSHEHAHCGVKV